MTRSEAKVLGLRYYDPQRPCPKGHTTGVWLTARGCCQECQRLANARPENRKRALAWQASPAGKAKVKAIKARYRATPAGSVAIKGYSARPETRARQLASAARLYHKNPASSLARKRAWRQANPEKMRAWDIARKYERTRATLILPEHLPLVRAMYREAKRLGMEVDHIVPLRGRRVCGLHILCNLQILPSADNRAKGNTFQD